jgi:hypothetical protein
VGIPPVWRRWFQDLFMRVGGTTGRLVVIEEGDDTAPGLDEIEARIASAVPERPDVGALERRIDALEALLTGQPARVDVAALEARLGALEADAAGRERVDIQALERRVEALEVDIAGGA